MVRNRSPVALPIRAALALPRRQEVRTMAGLMRREPREEAADVFGRYGKLFEE
jgi:hypothetical protein